MVLTYIGNLSLLILENGLCKTPVTCLNVTDQKLPESFLHVHASYSQTYNVTKSHSKRIFPIYGVLHPVILMLQIANAFFKLPSLFPSEIAVSSLLNSRPFFHSQSVLLFRIRFLPNFKIADNFSHPGDYLKPSEDEIEDLKRRLDDRLAPPPESREFCPTRYANSLNRSTTSTTIGKSAIVLWWHPDFETFMDPFVPAHITKPKECKKLFLVQMPEKILGAEEHETPCYSFVLLSLLALGLGV
ncbi:hypothetical protein BT96DRAFT_1069096 [Gymnopus androsaceus JB14]|uniref:Uncharacterized protein n=1 Tax=Gymnopus androsaceus JB14 TaxID=1447944 RepID=A0A6A4GV29_9AGAR|nr:hypothetical protein BT96DRAFT_1069096 [Gymnopus androsaceus JB14]